MTPPAPPDDAMPPPVSPDCHAPVSRWRRLGELVLRHPRLILAAVLALSAAAALVSALALHIRPGYVELLSPRSTSQARYLDLLHEFGNVEALHVVVQGDDAACATLVDRLGPAIAGIKGPDGKPAAANVLWRVDRRWFHERLPAWLPVAALDRATRPEVSARLASCVADPEPAALLAAAGEVLQSAAREGAASEDLAKEGPRGLAALVREMAAAARGETASFGHALDALAGGGQQSAMGSLDAEGRLRLGPGAYVITVRPTNVNNDADVMAVLTDRVREVAAALSRDLPAGTRVRLTGAPALLVDEMRAATWDMTWTTGISFVLVCLLFMVSFASMRHVAHAALTLGCGLALTFGAAWVLVGYLNLFSAVFGSILVGLGIDYGIHVVTHYETLRRAGASARDALLDAFEVVGPATAVGASANAAAFFAIMLAEFRGFSQLGLISGAGLLLCLAATFTLLPALMHLSSAGRSAKEDAGGLYRHDRRPWTHGVVQLPLRHPRAIALAGAGLVLLCLLGLPRLDFDYNLLNLQPAGTDAAALAAGEGPLRVSTHLACLVAGSVDEARALEERVRTLPSVASTHSAASLLPVDAESKREALGALSRALPDPPAAPRASVDAASVGRQASALAESIVSLQDLAFEGGRGEVVAAFDDVLAALSDLEMATALPGATAGLTTLRDGMAEDLAAMRAMLPELSAGRGVSPSDLPPALASALVGSTGRLAVFVEPRQAVWDRPALEEFVAQLRTVDPNVTGPPVQILTVMDTMRRSCVQAAWISLVAILVIVGIGFRHAGGVLLALAPVVAGFVVMLGVMAWLGVPLNPANLIALPIILGSGVDNGVPMVHRWLRTRDAKAAAGQVGHAVLICALESLAGFGSLMLASHRGVRSFGIATCIGALAMVLTALWVLPACLLLLDRLRARRHAAAAS